MSESPAQSMPHAPPKLIVSRPADEISASSPRSSVATRRRSKTDSAVLRSERRSNPHDWIDIDEPLPQRKRSSKRKTQRHDRSKRSVPESFVGSRDTSSEECRFRPKLGQIREGNESNATSRPATRGSDDIGHSERGSTRRQRHRDDLSLISRRLPKHRVSGLSKRTETVLQFNPSLLSVLSTLTRTSEKSSSSSNTITQRSYDRESSRAPFGRRGCSRFDDSLDHSRSSSVFDQMDRRHMKDGQDDQSVISSSSSHYEPSDAGSVELPSTPSSHSTYPSPTTTRAGSLNGSLHGGSVAELRRRYDNKYPSSLTSSGSVRSDSHSPEPSARGNHKRPYASDITKDNEDATGDIVPPSQARHDAHRRPASRSSVSSGESQRSNDHMQQQFHELRQHHGQPEHYIQPVYGQHRSPSASSTHSGRSTHSHPAYAQQFAMQQYQHLPSPAPIAHPIPQHPMNGHLLHEEAPPVPDAPDLTRQTIVGYEKLALELAKDESAVMPTYRRFEYLNHRVLLHIQDELCEMEDWLRTLDEIAAQMEAHDDQEPQHPSASRRRERYSSIDIYRQRTFLLGDILRKTEQYNTAMTAYNAMLRDCRPATTAQIAPYKAWLREHAPIHEAETRFLDSPVDLIVPGRGPSPSPVSSSSSASAAATAAAAMSSHYRPSKHAALTLLPVGLMLPLLLFSIIPTLAGRLAVTVLLTVGAFMVAATTRIRSLMPLREWAVCGAAYVLLMAAIAGCIPQHAT